VVVVMVVVGRDGWLAGWLADWLTGLGMSFVMGMMGMIMMDSVGVD
jgi:hypothetical protein